MTEISAEKISPVEQAARPIADLIHKYDGQNSAANAAIDGFNVTMDLIESQERVRLFEFRSVNNPSDLNKQLLEASKNHLSLISQNLEELNTIYQQSDITSFDEVSKSTLRTYENLSSKGITASDLKQAVVKQTGAVRII